MSNEQEFGPGEYIYSDGERITVLAVDGDARWIKFADGETDISNIHVLRSWEARAYVAPVVVVRWVRASTDLGWPSRKELTRCTDENILKLTFQDGKLVKAEVES